MSSYSRPVRISDGVTYTPAPSGSTNRSRRARVRRATPVITRQLPPDPPCRPTPEVVDAYLGSLDDEVAFDGLSGERRDAATRRRAALRKIGGDPADLMVALVDAGRPLAEAVRVAWNHPTANHRVLVVAMYQRLGASLTEVSSVLHTLGIDPVDRQRLLGLRPPTEIDAVRRW